MPDHVPKLGAIIDGPAERDAVHVAVVPLVAAGPLAPGAHVTEYGTLTAPGKGIGVVDPFLLNDLVRGERFYCFLYPNTAIGLRHVYRHPVLDADVIRRETLELLQAPAVQYIKECAALAELTYDEMMHTAHAYLDGGHERDISMSASNATMDVDWPKFWASYSLLTGDAPPKNTHAEPFNCNCS